MKRYFKDMGFMFFIDLFAASLLWIVWYEVNENIGAADAGADVIKFYGHFFFFIIIVIGPVLHILGTMEFFKPGTLKKNIIWKIDASKFLIVFLISLVGLSFYLKHHFIRHIENQGYHYCAEKSKRTSFSKEYVFIKNSAECKAD